MKCRICGIDVEDSDFCPECKKTIKKRRLCALFLFILLISWPILAMFFRFF